MFIETMLNKFSPSGQRARLSVLIFHRVALMPDPIFPGEMHAHRFNLVCGWLKSWFNVLPLDVAAAQLKAGTLPARAACITFDDGYADNHDVAMPILQSHGLSATFFIATGFLDGGRMWNDTIVETVRLAKTNTLDVGEWGQFTIATPTAKAAAIESIIGKIKYLPVHKRAAAAQMLADTVRVDLPDNLMMDSSQLKSMRRGGMQIGAHTQSHPILAKLDDKQALAEMEGSKHFLERLLSERIGLFAYPNGKPGRDYMKQHVAMARQADFDAAVSTDPGVSSIDSDPFQLPRFTPWDQGRFKFGIRMASNLRHVMTTK